MQIITSFLFQHLKPSLIFNLLFRLPYCTSNLRAQQQDTYKLTLSQFSKHPPPHPFLIWAIYHISNPTCICTQIGPCLPPSSRHHFNFYFGCGFTVIWHSSPYFRFILTSRHCIILLYHPLAGTKLLQQMHTSLSTFICH